MVDIFIGPLNIYLIRKLADVVQSLTEKAPGISLLPSFNLHLSSSELNFNMESDIGGVYFSAVNVFIKIGFNTVSNCKNLISVDASTPKFELYIRENENNKFNLIYETIANQHKVFYTIN